MKSWINEMLKSIFSCTIIGSLGMLYWNYFVVAKLGVGKEVTDISPFIVGAFTLFIINIILTGKNDLDVYHSSKFTWTELISYWIGGLVLIFLLR